MPNVPDLGATQEGALAKERRLESWGEIAAYLRREIRTVQRWEKTLRLPIRRLQAGKQSSVYAYPSELDKWYREREPNGEIDEVLQDEQPATLEANALPVPAPFVSEINAKPQTEIPFHKRRAA